MQSDRCLPAAGGSLASARRLVGRSRAQLRFRDLVLRAGKRNLWVVREDLARRYVFGSGIEIGALTTPLRLPPGVTVRQVDRMSREDLIREEGPALLSAGLDPEAIPHIDAVEDAARLAGFADRSLDFVIANHVFEHLEDPIEALENALRVIRPGGILLVTLPDGRHTFDCARTPTTVEHLVADHENGPEGSRRAHYEEWARLIEGVPEAQVGARADEFARIDARHHFHVWRLEDFLGLVLAVPFAAEVIHAQAYLSEFGVVLRRTDAAPAPASSER
jgi:predicted SAM-dependent methyltransferase